MFKLYNNQKKSQDSMEVCKLGRLEELIMLVDFLIERLWCLFFFPFNVLDKDVPVPIFGKISITSITLYIS